MCPTEDEEEVAVEEKEVEVVAEPVADSAPPEEPPPAVAEESVPSDSAESMDEEIAPNRLYRFAKKLMDRRELAEDTKDIMVAFLSTSDRAKTEMVKMTAREVRNYLEELRLKDDLLKLVRSHSLEVKASISLKPIEDALEPDSTSDEEE